MEEFKIGDKVLIEVQVTWDKGDYGGYHVQLPQRLVDPMYKPEEEDWYILPHELIKVEE